jgi:hypothetical protein
MIQQGNVLQRPSGLGQNSAFAAKQHDVAARQSEMSEWLDRLDVEIKRVSGITDVLTERLGPVLQQESGNKLADDRQPDAPLVPIADRLRSMGRAVASVHDRLADTLNRLEV